MTKDAVVLASMEKITLVGVYILILVVAGVWGWDGVDLNDRGGRMQPSWRTRFATLLSDVRSRHEPRRGCHRGGRRHGTFREGEEADRRMSAELS